MFLRWDGSKTKTMDYSKKDMGEGGVKKSEKLATSFMEDPFFLVHLVLTFQSFVMISVQICKGVLKNSNQ